MRQEFLPLSRPSIGTAEVAAVTECLQSGWLTGGPRVTRFEEAFAAAVRAEHAVTVSSATGGLHVTLLALGIGPGDEVITSPMTWAATANMILAVGATGVVREAPTKRGCSATPVFVDIDPGTLQIEQIAEISGVSRARVT
jgi:UDP-4-amino-4-deoxy-L-arabinose-oxoglutarate aminotransferase